MKKLRFMVIGAHPDDCDSTFGGTALRLLGKGHEVMFLSLTNGCSGHYSDQGVKLIARRYEETQKVAAMTGIYYKMLDIPDAFLTTELKYREMVISEIRAYKPDFIFTHRPWDYHADHRNTGLLVQDASYLLMVPNVVCDSPALRYCPVIMYLEDSFTKPYPFHADAVVDISDTFEGKVRMMHCHTSQYYEWLPYVDGRLSEVPPASDEAGRLAYLTARALRTDVYVADKCRETLSEFYPRAGQNAKAAEAFELCEYGAPCTKQTLMEVFGEQA